MNRRSVADRGRDALASVLVAIALLIVAWWLFRRILGFVLWVANVAAVVVVVVALLVIASRLRRRPER